MSHPLIMRLIAARVCRPLDAGGGLLLYTGVPFRICFILFRGEWVIPLDLTPSAFRVIRKGEDGDALIVQSFNWF